MKRELTKREKILLLVLAVMVIGLGYFRLIFEPVNDQISQYRMDTEGEQCEILSNTIKLAQMRSMEKKIAEVKVDGTEKAIPTYDNSVVLMRELYRILDATQEYSLDFSSPVEQDGYVVMRPVSMTFKTGTYQQARAIIDQLCDSGNINQISDLSIADERSDGAGVTVDALITFFEIAS